jgi:AcrR family transcriptional regulator
MQEKKLSRREREKLRQRQEMLDAAVKLFSKDGYHNVSMLKIAQEAEFAIGTLYKFFRNMILII